jgi:hypothetical protein
MAMRVPPPESGPHGVSAVIRWVYESSGGLTLLTAFTAAFVAAVVWVVVWLAVVLAALALKLAVERHARVRGRSAQSATR